MSNLKKSMSMTLLSGLNTMSNLKKSPSMASMTLSSGLDEGFQTDSAHSCPSIVAPFHDLAVEAAEKAKISFHRSLSSSLLAEKSKNYLDCIARFKWEEVMVGQLLGSGQFSHVYQVKSFRFANHKCDAKEDTNQGGMSVEEMDQRLYMQEWEKKTKTKKSRYALKIIKTEHLVTDHGRMKYVQASRDLALEQEILSSICHPHIIKLRGIVHSGPTGSALVLDRLVETLDQRLKRWRRPGRSGSNLSRSITGRLSDSFTRRSTDSTSHDVSSSTLESRLSVAFQIAAALKYLHSHSIIFRDLKPVNIGFDVRGDAKIFDFGLARFCPEGDGSPRTDIFEMSNAGSPRYMAPECLVGEPYNLKADVYSFSILLWEILSGKRPYMVARRKEQLVNIVVELNERPDISKSWPGLIQATLENSFDSNMGSRPDMKEVYMNIMEVLAPLRGIDRRDLDESATRRRSVTMV